MKTKGLPPGGSRNRAGGMPGMMDAEVIVHGVTEVCVLSLSASLSPRPHGSSPGPIHAQARSLDRSTRWKLQTRLHLRAFNTTLY